jgi:hypothetical protein
MTKTSNTATITLSNVVLAAVAEQAANVAAVVGEIAKGARTESLHYTLALGAIETLWEVSKGNGEVYTAAISELAADVHATCVAAGIRIGKRVKEDDGTNDDDADRRERGRANTFMSQFRVIARKMGETKGEFNLDRPFWRCYEDSKAAGTGSNRSKNKKGTPVPSAVEALPAAELAAALESKAATDNEALRLTFETLHNALLARKATIDVQGCAAMALRHGIKLAVNK